MKRTVQPENSLEDLELLAQVLHESYTASYKGSSLKVRRRYRKLLSALGTDHQARSLAGAYALKGRADSRLNRD